MLSLDALYTLRRPFYCTLAVLRSVNITSVSPPNRATMSYWGLPYTDSDQTWHLRHPVAYLLLAAPRPPEADGKLQSPTTANMF